MWLTDLTEAERKHAATCERCAISEGEYEKCGQWFVYVCADLDREINRRRKVKAFGYSYPQAEEFAG